MPTIALIGVGLATYWPQFPQLHERLLNYLNQVEKQLEEAGATVVSGGLLDDPKQQTALANRFAAAQADAVVVYITTYALSHTVLALLRQLKRPILILNLQPGPAIDYAHVNGMEDRGAMTGEWLAWCQSCVAPELSSVLQRAQLGFDMISGHLQQPQVGQKIRNWLAALRVTKQFAQLRVGLLGQYYNGMMDVYSDLTQLSAATGAHFELLEPGQLVALRQQVSDADISNKRNEFERSFNVSEHCSDHALAEAARSSLALDKLVQTHDLQALAYYYEAQGSEEGLSLVVSMIPGLTLLTGAGLPTAGEYEVKNVLAMKILQLLGAGGSFSEFYAVDYTDDVVLWGHDGPAHLAIAEGQVGLVPVPVYHGKPGSGLSIQMQVKHGPVTLLSLCQGSDGKLFLLVAEAEAVAGPTLQIGNTNSRYKFPLAAADFVQQWSLAGPSHHCAIGVGHCAAIIDQLGRLWSMAVKRIC